ncbi:MAG TPA: histidine kinase [Bryobacteraceae bacterium]|jgi:two-component system LytT family sensor kinase|nr:histidine kinase [Bryobacteraceae bacterium]
MRLRPPRAKLAKAGLLFAVWTVYGLLCAWQNHYFYSFSRMPMSWADALRLEMGYGYIWGACSPLILWLARHFRIDRDHLARHLAIHIGAMTVFIVATQIAFDALLRPPDSAFIHFNWPALIRSIESTADTGALIYWVIILFEHASVYYGRYQRGLVDSSRLQTQLAKAQLQALKMQLHPHFLFNTLHTITALVHEDPDLAEKTITRLSELLRLFLATSMIHEVPLSEELRILGLYIDIEQTRFEDRLRVHEDVPSGLRDAMVPNLVLQPIVENSIRHGLCKRARPGRISVSAERLDDTLVLRVVDNGTGLQLNAAKGHQPGMGLAITRNRLKTLYGDSQSLELRNIESGGVEALITIPFRTYVETAEEGEHGALQSIDR